MFLDIFIEYGIDPLIKNKYDENLIDQLPTDCYNEIYDKLMNVQSKSKSAHKY